MITVIDGFFLWGWDFSAVARAIGLHAELVEHKIEVSSAIERAFAHPGPALLDITTDPDAVSAPPKATYEDARGFALAMPRMVIEHRGDQVFDLVKDNIRGMV